MIYIDQKKKIKYDTEKMELVSSNIRIANRFLGYDMAELYKSEKGNWLLVRTCSGVLTEACPISEKTAIDLIIKYDPIQYEKYFEKLEEA